MESDNYLDEFTVNTHLGPVIQSCGLSYTTVNDGNPPTSGQVLLQFTSIYQAHYARFVTKLCTVIISEKDTPSELPVTQI